MKERLETEIDELQKLVQYQIAIDADTELISQTVFHLNNLQEELKELRMNKQIFGKN